MIHQEFRAGNVASADDNLSFVQQCEAQLPKNRKINYLRADAATYQAELFNYCNKNHITYVIGGHLDSSVLSTIEEIREWEPLDTDHAFRIIVVKKNREILQNCPFMQYLDTTFH